MSAPEPSPPEPSLEGNPFQRLGQGLLWVAGLGLLVLLVFSFVSDRRELAKHLAGFDWGLLPLLLALSLVNYGLRFARWQFYLRIQSVHLSVGVSLVVHLVGFVLSVTPGKAGELGKAWLARELGGASVRRVLPVVLAERITDLLGVALLIGVGAWTFAWGPWFLLMTLLAIGAVVALLAYRSWAHWVFDRLATTRWSARIDALREAHDGLVRLVRPRALTVALMLSTVAWGAEGVALHYLLQHYDTTSELSLAVFNYSASTIAGALSMLPAGLVASEGAMTLLLESQGIPLEAAVSATLIIRAVTLWFAIALGLVAAALALAWLRRLKSSR